MKRAAFGVQMHSGWGVLVAVSEGVVEILARQRVVTADPEIPGAIQPYHFAAGFDARDQEKLAKADHGGIRKCRQPVAEQYCRPCAFHWPTLD